MQKISKIGNQYSEILDKVAQYSGPGTSDFQEMNNYHEERKRMKKKYNQLNDETGEAYEWNMENPPLNPKTAYEKYLREVSNICERIKEIAYNVASPGYYESRKKELDNEVKNLYTVFETKLKKFNKGPDKSGYSVGG